MSKLKTYAVAVYVDGNYELFLMQAANAAEAETLVIKTVGRSDIIVSRATIISKLTHLGGQNE